MLKKKIIIIINVYYNQFEIFNMKSKQLYIIISNKIKYYAEF